jgi:phosphatidylinositol 4-kinase B
VQFVLFAVSTGNSISFSTYILRAATLDGQNGSWLNRGIAVAAISAVCLIHAFAPRVGIWLSNALGAFKLVLLSLVVCTGFAALSGRMVVPKPGNFDTFNGPGDAVSNAGESSAATAAGYALALLQVLYSYSPQRSEGRAENAKEGGSFGGRDRDRPLRAREYRLRESVRCHS